ncbi:MAG: RtcB family protein [Nanoarchaeota archaeon]|nr:RtcB family protein [Nanoarchaeota archaeon]
MMNLKKVSDFEWKMPKTGSMRVDGIVYASEELLNVIRNDRTLEQLQNMASLPGIQKHAIALPDAHQGYGFCIGGVAALSTKEGGISPGGVGFDINCGVRVLKTNLTLKEVSPKIKDLLDSLFKKIPSGVGSEGALKLSIDELKDLLEKGVNYLKQKGLAVENDIINCENNGCMKEANAEKVSERALNRGKGQVGTLGSGNHFLDIHVVDEIIDEKLCKKFGIFKNQVNAMIHCGSRGLGHQVASDYVRKIENTFPNIVNSLPDRELAYAPSNSQVAIDYFSAMSASANYAWANRQLIMNNARDCFMKVFDGSIESLGLELFYDVCHNIAKIETHEGVECFVHRKGATKSFPGDKVIIPGSMGTNSYLLVGGDNSMSKTFGSTAHGAGRVMSRTKAKKEMTPESVMKEMSSKGILLKSSTRMGAAEESEHAYKDIEEVIRVSKSLGIAKPIAKLRPVAVING